MYETETDHKLITERMLNYQKIEAAVRDEADQIGGVLLQDQVGLTDAIALFHENSHLLVLRNDRDKQYQILFFAGVEELKIYAQENLNGVEWVSDVYCLDDGRQLDYCWKLEVV